MSLRQAMASDDLEILKEENELLEERIKILEAEQQIQLSNQTKLLQTIELLKQQNQLLKIANQNLEETNITYQTNYQLILNQNGLLKIKNTELLDYIQNGDEYEDEQNKLISNITLYFDQTIIQDETTKTQFDIITLQLTELRAIIEQTHGEQGQINTFDLEGTVRDKVYQCLEEIMQGNVFEQLVLKIEERITNQLLDEQKKVYIELEALEARQLEFASKVEPVVQLHEIKVQKLYQIRALLNEENTKQFYQKVYKYTASKFLAVIVLFSELVKREDRKIEKVGKLGGALAANIFDGFPGASFVGTIVGFTIEETVSAVKGHFQEKKTRRVMDSLPDPKQAMSVAELIARRLTEHYAVAILEISEEKTIHELAENCSRAIYNFIKHGGLDKYNEVNSEEKVQIIIHNIKKERIFEDKVPVIDVDDVTGKNYAPINPPAGQSYLEHKHIRQRFESVANKAESTRSSFELSSLSSQKRIDWLQRGLEDHKETNSKEITRLEHLISRERKERDKEIKNLKTQLNQKKEIEARPPPKNTGKTKKGFFS